MHTDVFELKLKFTSMVGIKILMGNIHIFFSKENFNLPLFKWHLNATLGCIQKHDVNTIHGCSVLK